MDRARATIVSLLLTLAGALPALAADVPTGELVLHGTKREAGGRADVDGTLTVAPLADGTFALTRSVRAKDGLGFETASGTARESNGELVATLTATDGLAGAVAGASSRPALHAVYSLDDGELRGKVTSGSWTSDETACTTEELSKKKYFAFLDRDAAFQTAAKKDALAAALDLIARKDVPPGVDEHYTRKAGSVGGGRVRLLLDYTRGFASQSSAAALREGPKSLAAKILEDRLAHFRLLGGASIFPGDVGFQRPFKDDVLTSPETNQVGHLLCAVDSGVRLAFFEKHPIERRAFELVLRTGGIVGVHGVEPSVPDWSRAGIIGHEMVGDEDGSGFLGQMNAYGRLVAHGDPDHIRQAWDDAIAAVQASDHLRAWTAIRRIARAGEIPETLAEKAANTANPHPRFATPGSTRDGNSLADLALSAYGFALGHRSESRGWPTPEAARAELFSFFHAGGRQEPAIAGACDATR